MSADFLSEFIGNSARARALRAYVSNETSPMTISLAAKLAGLSVKIMIRETKALTKMGIVKKMNAAQFAQYVSKKIRGSQVKEEATAKGGELWVLDPEFSHVRALSAFVQETAPVQYKNIERALKGSGKLSAVVLSGVFVGDPSRPADLLIAGDSLNESRLEKAVKALEPMFGREIRYAAFSTPEFRYRLTIQDRLFRDTLEFPHRILMSRNGIFKKA